MNGKATSSSKRLLVAILTIALCVVTAFALAGCGGTKTRSAEGTYTFTDSCGRQVEVPSSITRVAVTGPVAQQIMFTFDSSKLVGLATSMDDAQCKYLGEGIKDLPIYGQLYGGKGNVNKEVLAEAAPEVIIDIGEAKDTIVEDMDGLQEQLSIPCVHIEAQLDSLDETYTLLGDLLNMPDRGKEIADYCKDVYDSNVKVLGALKDDEKPTGLYVVNTDGQNVIAKNSYQSAVFDLVFNNLAVIDNPSGKGTGNQVGLEQIALWNPEYIVFSSQSAYDSVGTDPAWQSLSAVASGKYVEDPGLPYDWCGTPPSVNQLLGLQWLGRMVYPDKFKDSVQDTTTKYFKVMYGYDLSADEFAQLTANANVK